MIDCHTHLIPGLDDGSADLESSIKAFRQMADGGIKSVICTTHYMRGLYQFDKDVYNSKFRELEQEIHHQNIPIHIYPGAEVFLVSGIGDDIREKNLTLAESSYILLETNLNGFPPDLHKILFELVRQGYKPILAHAERYVSVMAKSQEAKDIINRSVYIQVNAASIIGGYGEKVKDTVWKLLNKGWVHLLASDHHGKSDYNAFFAAKNKIIEHIDEQTAYLLTNKHPKSIINNTKIDFEYVYVQKPTSYKHRSGLSKLLGI
jgi:protein-tyrosine phosphatase